MIENFLIDNENGRYFNPASSILIDYTLLMFIAFSLNQLVENQQIGKARSTTAIMTTLLFSDLKQFNDPIFKRLGNGTFMQLLFIGMFTHLVNPGKINYIRCMKGQEVDFNYPDCPENSCRLKKLPEGLLILRDGILSHLHPRYSFNEQKTQLRLKECNEGDEGKYLWLCEKCNVTEHIYLEINQPQADERLHCALGGEVSFKCPCCPEELDSCRFKKLFEEWYIVRDGVLNMHGKSNNGNKYQMNPGKTHLILNHCVKNDEGTYIWMCGKCNANKHFHVDVHQHHVAQQSSTTKVSPQATTLLLLCGLYFCMFAHVYMNMSSSKHAPLISSAHFLFINFSLILLIHCKYVYMYTYFEGDEYA